MTLYLNIGDIMFDKVTGLPFLKPLSTVIIMSF